MFRFLTQFKKKIAGDSNAGRVILISLDCVRPETLGFYGDKRAKTPNIDKVIKAGVSFTQTICQAPYTPASHASILTGLNPYRHGIRTIMGQRLLPSVRTLQDILKSSGYSTAAFISTQALGSAYGLNRGFDIYDEDFEQKIGWWHTGYKRPCRETTDRAMDWLKLRASDESWFLFCHYIDAHSMSGEVFCWDYQLRKVEMIDKQIGRLIRLMKKRGWLDSAMVIITSDHGDSFGEHSERGHREYLYDSTLRVPLVIKFPYGFRSIPKDITVDIQVRSIDITPTVLDALDLLSFTDQHENPFDGVSLTYMCDGNTASDLLAYSETCHEVSEKDWNFFKTHFLGLRDGKWKYIYDKLTGNEELYNLSKDPSELDNLAAKMPEKTATFRKRLWGLLSEHSQQQAEATTEMSDADREEVAEQLRALGYLG